MRNFIAGPRMISRRSSRHSSLHANKGSRWRHGLERYPQHAIALIDLASALDAYDSTPEPDAQAVAATTRLLHTALTQVAGPPVPPPAPRLIARGRGAV